MATEAERGNAPASTLSATSEASIRKLGQEIIAALADERAMYDCEEGFAGGTRLQNLICIGIPLYNEFAPMFNLPVIPVPAFCTPTPTP